MNKCNVKQIKSFYDNLKRKSKKTYADERMERVKTGGGIVISKTDDTTLKLLSLLKDQLDPLSNNKDSDALYHAGKIFIIF